MASWGRKMMWIYWSNISRHQSGLTSWLMSWDVASIYPHHFPSSWCHLFCEVHQSLLQQSTPTTWCCHPRASRLEWCSSACKPTPFCSKHNDGHYGQTVLFCFIRPEDISPKSMILVLICRCKPKTGFFMAVLEQCLLPYWAASQVMSI